MGKRERTCRHCGESNPRTFEVCWKCGESLEGAELVESKSTDSEPAFPVGTDSAPPVTISHDRPFGRWTDWAELLGVLSIVTIYPVLAQVFYGPANRPETVARQLVPILSYGGLTVVVWLLIRRDRSMLQPVPLGSCHWGMEFLYGLLLMMAAWMINAMVMMLPMEVRSGDIPPAQTYTTGLFLATCVHWIFTCTLEEVTCRVYLQSKLQSLLGGRVALSIVLGAVAFVAPHGYSLRSSFGMFLASLLFGVVYQDSRRVPRLVIAHWLYNVWTLCLRIHMGG